MRCAASGGRILGRELEALGEDKLAWGRIPRPAVVAGAGFEPATSGRHQGCRDRYGLGPEATDSLGVVRDSPSLPVTGYPSSTEWDGPNLDSRWTPIESHPDASGFKDGSADEVRVVPAGDRVDSPFAKVVAETGCVLASMRWADLRCDEPSPG